MIIGFNVMKSLDQSSHPLVMAKVRSIARLDCGKIMSPVGFAKAACRTTLP